MAAKWSTKDIAKNVVPDFGELLKDEFAVVLLQGKNTFGDMIYCYLKVALRDVRRLQAALQTPTSFTASDYGSVVAAGKGEPTAEVKAEIASTYKVLKQVQSMRPPSEVSPDEKKAWDEY